MKMKKVTKFFMAALLAGVCSLGYAQDYLSAPKANERVLGTISINYNEYYKPEYANRGSMNNWHELLLKKAQKEYGNAVFIRDMQVGSLAKTFYWGSDYYGPATGKVVCKINPDEESQEKLPLAINKALLNVTKGSRTAIDQITVVNNMDSEKLKDQIIDILLEKEYRVVAKEYLERLYREQQDQQSGIYNERTTVQENNFSAVGYFINVKVTETSIRVQVVNVSTGEYEGNATVNF